MGSKLFRRETGRRLRARREQIADTYLEERYDWLAAFGKPSREYLYELVGILADAVEGAKVEEYCRFTAIATDSQLQNGFSPILLLAAAQLFEEAVLAHLTPDQQDLVGGLLLVARDRRQILLYEQVMRTRAQGA